jgi:DNA-binding NtrC family response regulator/tetratricopeptide (TPR) repeat protein
MPGFAELLGESPALIGLRHELQQLVRRYATARRLPPILLLGETGTGKSMIARALHAEGPRAGRPFVDVACPEIPETLMESEMFGVERGAFTDARQSRAGRFAEADRGTIFLDEIGLLPDSLQAKLLKIVEEQQLRPLGATASRPIDVWIIAATSEDLEAAVRKRRFREDLYFRLAVVTLRVPPLRERGDDVVILARRLLARACTDYGLATKTFTPDALAALKAHQWPGNVRELGNVIERVALRSEGPFATAEVLGLSATDESPMASPDGDRTGGERPDIDTAVAGLERTRLLEALDAARGNVTRAAQRLGLTRNTFRYRLRKHGMARGPGHAPFSPGASPAPRPSGVPRWERRRVAFLRVALAPTDDGAEHRRPALLEEVREKVVGFGGTLDGVSPAGVTAVFGLDLLEDAPRRAAHAAMAIRKLGVRAREGDPTLPAIKLAIHGLAALLWKTADGVHVDADARPGIWQTLDRLVAGDVDGSIVVSEPTSELLRSMFHLIDAPDRGGACLLLDGERAVIPRTAGSVFAGRRDEMTMLRGRFELARAGRGQVVGIAGEPGIGKSRVLFEFRRTLAADTVTYLSARSQPHGRDLLLLPIIELLRRAHGIEEQDSPDVIRDKLRSRLNVLGMPADEMTPYLMRLLGSGNGIDTIAHLSPQELHQRTLEIFRGIALASSRAGPLVVAVEDLHWMDRASEGYLAALVDALVEAPILLLTTSRGGHRPPWSERSYVSELRLQPLARADARLVLDAALGRERRPAPLPTAIAEAILDRADGNPFFIEELARAVGPAAEAVAPVPQSIEAVLLARIDRLPDESKGVLQAASVLGRDVPVRLLEAITPETATPTERLRELQQLEYLHDRSDGTQQLYRFKHALTQEVAYSSLLAEHRRGLHARVVGAIEVQYADRLDEHTEKLAHHAVQGQLWERAAPYLRQAGLKAADRSANHEAVACLEQALEALGHLPGGRATNEAIDLHLDLGRVLVPLADYGGCLEHLSEAAKLADARGERGRRGRALASQCLMLRITGATYAAIEAGRAALAIASEVADADLAATASFFLGTAHHTRGEFREAAACYRAGLIPLLGAVTPERARMLPRYTGGVRAWLAWTLESLGEFGEALVLGREAVQIAEARGDRAPDAAARCLLANVHLGLGDTGRAIPLLEQALILCRAHDVRDWMGFVAMRLGFAYAHAGRLAEGVRLLEEGDAHCEAIRGVTGHATRLAGFAQSLLLAGRHAEAGETARRGVVLAREQHQPAGEAVCLRAMGMVTAAADSPDTAAAESYFTQARDMAATLEMRPLVAHCHCHLGKLARSTERHDEAREHLAAAALMYRDMGMQFWLDEMAAESKKVPSGREGWGP